MRISQLIEFLTKAQAAHGDIFVENGDGIIVTARVETFDFDTAKPRTGDPVVVID